uniref:bifunctional acetate--CoA ligase family protein/GNAT family N-acetyltransferase n=1 Tax=Ramlibacter sp. TaxID=1917967 RepID=UPI002FC6BADA
VPAEAIAQACLPAIRHAGKPVLTSWLGGPSVEAARRVFTGAGLAWYPTPERAVAAWQQLVHYHRGQQALLQLPDDRPHDGVADRARAEGILRQAVAQGREWLDDAQAMGVLEAYGIPVVPTRRVQDIEGAADAAAQLGFPVALKIVSPQVVHKSDVGGVALNLRNGDELRKAAVLMRQNVARGSPQAHVLGFTVQKMVQRPRARELILGIASDAVFGPVLLFGAGGTSVEVSRDSATELPPLNVPLARGLVARTRIGALLGAHRGQDGVDQDALTRTLLQLSQMACELAAVAELDINPLLVDAQGVVALDARIRLRQPAAGEGSRLALRPYPSALEEQVKVGDQPLVVRPIRPEDGARMAAFYAAACPADLRLRFFMARREVPHSELARYCQIDYEREMTFIALSGDAMVGEVRAVTDPDNVAAEFAIQVAGDWQGRGLGRLLLAKMLAYLRGRGTAEVFGTCLQENAGMAALARRMGFAVTPNPDGTLALRRRLD